MRVFIELSPFRSYLDKRPEGQEMLLELQGILLRRPEEGALVQGTGGIRKLRLAGKGKGKSGGFRIWYLYFAEVERIYLMTIYSKNEKEDLSDGQRNDLRRLVDILMTEAKNGKK